MNDQVQDDDGLTPDEQAEEDRKPNEAQQLIRNKVAAGWSWDSSKNLLTHPDDAEINIWIDPYRGMATIRHKLGHCPHKIYTSPARVSSPFRR